MVGLLLLYVGGYAEFVRLCPAATKRVLRAILKATDLCVSEPKRVAQMLVDGGYAARYDYALQALADIRYDVWHDYNPDDSLRFYGLEEAPIGVLGDQQ